MLFFSDNAKAVLVSMDEAIDLITDAVNELEEVNYQFQAILAYSNIEMFLLRKSKLLNCQPTAHIFHSCTAVL